MPTSRWRRRSRSGVSDIIAVILLTAMTITAGVIVWYFVIPTPTVQPTIKYTAIAGATYPAWGDPTDCWPNLANNWTYYLSNYLKTGHPDTLYRTYMNAWWNDCEYGTNGTYNQMNATEIVFTQVTGNVPLADIQFNFICHNNTPAPVTTFLTQGSLAAMSWFPGSSQSIPSNAPTLGYCATFNAKSFGGGAFSVYYNRLGFFKPLSANETLLQPGSSFVLYIHTAGSVREAPSPIEPSYRWNLDDADDFHGAPSWCFTVPGACTIELVDTAVSNTPALATIPVFDLHQ